MPFYQILENIMKEKNLKIPDIARSSGLSDSTIRAIITRKSKNVSLEVAFKLSKALDVSLERLNGDEHYIESQDPTYNSNLITLGEKIREARKAKNLTQRQLADAIGVANSTISGYESGTREPDFFKFKKIVETLSIDADYLLGTDRKNHLPEIDYSILERFNSLDSHGKEVVETILDLESKRVRELKHSINESHDNLSRGTQEDDCPTKIIPYFQKIASAGSGEYLFDYIPTDTIKVPLDYVSEEADFVVGVNGDSMEPYYHDGDKVLVKKTTEKLEMDKVGIFMIGNDVLIKRVGETGLISDNKRYTDIPYTGSQDIKLIGEVLGKTSPERETNLSDGDIKALHIGAKIFNENPKISSFPFGNK